MQVLKSGRLRLPVAALLRKLLPGRKHAERRSRHTLRVLRDAREIHPAAIVLARSSRLTPSAVRQRLTQLFELDASVLYVQLDSAGPHRIVFARSDGNKLIVSWRRGHLETELEATSPNGAYLTERQYRQLGLYEVPPEERAVIVVHIEGDHGPDCVIDVPKYISGVTLVTNGTMRASNIAMTARDRMEFDVE